MPVVCSISCSKSTDGSSCSGSKAVTDFSILLAFAKKYSINPGADTHWMYDEIIRTQAGASPNKKTALVDAAFLLDKKNMYLAMQFQIIATAEKAFLQ